MANTQIPWIHEAPEANSLVPHGTVCSARCKSVKRDFSKAGHEMLVNRIELLNDAGEVMNVINDYFMLDHPQMKPYADDCIASLKLKTGDDFVLTEELFIGKTGQVKVKIDTFADSNGDPVERNSISKWLH